MFRIILLLCKLLLVLPTLSVQAAGFDHSGWGNLLKEHVRVFENGKVSQVDYAGMAGKRDALDDYLRKLSAVGRDEFDAWSMDEQLAFLLNAYNSWTVELILTKYPDLDSIKDLGSWFESPWKKDFTHLLGKKRSLDDIEHGLIRGSGRYNDPRIHFAANCASIGCPALRAEPYLGADLRRQLDEATNLFLEDRSRNRLDGRVLKVSSIFKWYRGDFEKGWQSVESLEQFLADHAEDLGLTKEETEQVLTGKIKIEFLSYDWKLNSIL
ncbi:MAG: DUF547 domain-containing protein [Desulforhopalus sp.]|nr:DUF547 domain-containing protein [Desulforhopalus sp.]